MDDQDPRLEGERATYRTTDTTVGRASEPGTLAVSVQAPDLPAARIAGSSGSDAAWRPADATDDDSDEPRLRQLQDEIAETRGDIASTLGAIEDRLRPSTLAASAAEAVTDKAASIGDSIATSQPARYARANPWGTALAVTGAVVAVWLMLTPRRRRRRTHHRQDRRRGGGHEFTRTHYDAGVEHPLDSAGTRVAGVSPAPMTGVTHPRTEERQHDACR